MWVYVIMGGVAVGLVLLAVWSLLVMAARGEEAMERLMASLENHV